MNSRAQSVKVVVLSPLIIDSRVWDITQIVSKNMSSQQNQSGSNVIPVFCSSIHPSNHIETRRSSFSKIVCLNVFPKENFLCPAKFKT